MLLRSTSLVALAFAFLTQYNSARAQPLEPPLPSRYQVLLRYDIPAARDQHVVQYDTLINYLKRLNFTFDPPLSQLPPTDREDRSKNKLHGFIAPDRFLRLFGNHDVAAILVMPEGFAFPPAEVAAPVRVRLELASGLPSDRQRELAEQVKAILAALGFREATAYDHHGYSGRPFTRLVGAIPQGQLDILLKDLRGQPAGWFAPRIPPQELPSPLRNVNPIRVIEVIPDPQPLPPPVAVTPQPPAPLASISTDLWAVLGAKVADTTPLRVEIIFSGIPAVAERGWRALLDEVAPGTFVEGQLGQIVSAVVRAGQVKAIAALPQVSTIRLQRPARVDIDPNIVLPGDNAKALAQTGLDALHKNGFRGQGVRLAILDTDFRGWEALVRQGKLPPATRLIDLTRESDPELFPTPPAGDPSRMGHGTQCALAAALAAPDARLYLVRIEGTSPYQLDEVARLIKGDTTSSAYIDRRRDELVTARAELDHLRAQVQQERRAILDNYADEADLEREFGFLGPVYGWIFSPRAWSRQRVAYVEKLEADLAKKNERFFNLMEDIRALAGIQVLANALLWTDGYALGGASPLSRAFDRTLAPPAPPTPPHAGHVGFQAGAAKAPLLWLQSAGNTRGQSWFGLFRDTDGNGFMEFTPLPYQPRQGRWTNELNFLAWQPFAKAQMATLPEGTTLRLTMQWREPHDPDYFARPGEPDLYRKPLADLRIALLRQRDPAGKEIPSDAMDLVAVSAGVPERLEHQPSGSIYEVVLETTIQKAGRYAVRIERPVGRHWTLAEAPATKRLSLVQLEALQPTGLRPFGVVTLPALEKQWELQTRLFVAAAGPERLQGRPLLADYATDEGSVGVPSDARSVFTVGAADSSGQPRSYSAGGPLAFAELLRKPSLLAFDALGAAGGGAFGTSIATSFAAGTLATGLSAGLTYDHAVSGIHQLGGGVLVYPEKGR